MKISIVTDSWPTIGADSIYLNAAFRKEASNMDICIITTSRDGFGTVEGLNNIIINRLESVPRRPDKFFFDKVSKVLSDDKPDILFVLNPVKELNYTDCKLCIAHWTSSVSSAVIDEEVLLRYQKHTTFDEKHKLRLLSAGVSDNNIFVLTPKTAHSDILSILDV